MSDSTTLKRNSWRRGRTWRPVLRRHVFENDASSSSDKLIDNIAKCRGESRMDGFAGSIILLMGLAVVFVVAIAGCSTVGNGRSTLVLGRVSEPSVYKGHEFSAILTNCKETQLRAMGGSEVLEETTWTDLVKERFPLDKNQRSGPQVAAVSLSLRDRTRTPVFASFNLDIAQRNEIIGVLLNDKIEAADKRKLIAAARNNFETLPEVPERVVFDRYIPAEDNTNAGAPEWRYFVELEVDLTGTLETADPLMQFSYLGAALRVPDGVQAKFINFSPKAADLYEIAIGQLKASGTITANAKQGGSIGRDITVVDKSKGDVETTQKSTSGGTSELGLALQLNEEFTREIKAGLDVRSAGIHEDGRVFLIELRGTDLQRIAGTYTYEVMMEIESEPQQSGDSKIYYSQPKVRQVQLETRSVGVVRHVVKRGKVGVLNRIPEPMNDDTFHQVIVSDGTTTAWRFREMPRGDRVMAEQELDNLVVRTAHADAAFLVRDRQTKDVKGFGAGKQATFRFDPGTRLTVEFLPIVITGPVVVELAAKVEQVDIPAKGASTVVARYTIEKSISAGGKE